MTRQRVRQFPQLSTDWGRIVLVCIVEKCRTGRKSQDSLDEDQKLDYNELRTNLSSHIPSGVYTLCVGRLQS